MRTVVIIRRLIYMIGIRFLCLLLLLQFASQSLNAQKYSNNWYFGSNHALLDFDNGTPTLDETTPLYALEGSACISDTAGNLLFYTNGVTVWNANHVVMQNGNFLVADPSSTQSCIIIPKPASKNKYYIFTTAAGWGNIFAAGLRYSEVDMSLNGGLGGVTGIKNVPLTNTITEKLVAIQHSNCRDFWIIVHKENSNTYHSYQVSESGVNPVPVISNTGTNFAQWMNAGNMKPSPDGTKIAAATYSGHVVDVSDFDRSTGVLSNTKTLPTYNTVGAVYGVEFSPDGSKLYYTGVGTIYINNIHYDTIFQWDLDAGNLAAIIASKTPIGITDSIDVINLQLAPDGKIYVTSLLANISGRIDAIQSPNLAGMACNYTGNVFNMLPQNGSTGWGMTNSMQMAFQVDSIRSCNDCYGSTTSFSFDITHDLDSVHWNFGDTNSQTNTSSAYRPYHAFSQEGVFIVELIVYYGIHKGFQVDTLYDTVEVWGPPTISLPNDTAFWCLGKMIGPTVMSGLPTSFNWSTGAVDSAISITQAGTYWVEVTNDCGTATDTITIDSLTDNYFNLGNDTLLCPSDILWLDATVYGGTYSWNNGSDSSHILAQDSGMYVVTAVNVCGSFTDSILIQPTIIPATFLGNDTAICLGDSHPLSAYVLGGSYQWNNGQTSSSIQVSQAGDYWVEVTNLCGLSHDTITITTDPLPGKLLASDIKLCEGDSLQVGIITPILDGKLLWNTGATDSAITITKGGRYKLWYSNACGVFEESITALELPLPISTFPSDTVLCAGENIKLNPSLFARSYIWSDSSGGTTLKITEQGTYWIEAENECGISIDSIEVSIRQSKAIELGTDSSVCPGDPITLDVSSSGISYAWNDGSNDPIRTITRAGRYRVSVTDEYGCISKDEIIIDACEPHVWIPKAFSPDNDGLNDVFKIEGENIYHFHIMIFDRWGGKIYESFNKEEGWDGTHHGELCPNDVYSHRILYRNESGSPSEVYGKIMLLK